MNYFEAHRARMQRNNDALLKLADEVIEADSSIEVYICRNDNLQSSVSFFKGELINGIGFHEVPYHWSGCGISDHSGGENISMPFTVDDVLKSFSPVTNIVNRRPTQHTVEYFKSKEQYLKWCSYLKQYNGKDI